MNLGLAFGATLAYTSSAAGPRRRSPRRCAAIRRYAGLATLAFARPVSAQHWLQASNPSERWKWDFMFQDLPPVKGFAGDAGAEDHPLVHGLPDAPKIEYASGGRCSTHVDNVTLLAAFVAGFLSFISPASCR